MDERGEPDGPEVTDALFAENVRIRREGLGFSQAEVMRRLREAGWANVHQTTVSRIEKGERAPRLGEARLIATALQTTVDRLLRPVENLLLEDYLEEIARRATRHYIEIGSHAKAYFELMDKVSMVVDFAKDGVSDVDGRHTKLSPDGGGTLSVAILRAREAIMKSPMEAVEEAEAEHGAQDGQEIVDQQISDRLRGK